MMRSYFTIIPNFIMLPWKEVSVTDGQTIFFGPAVFVISCPTFVPHESPQWAVAHWHGILAR